MFEMMGYARGRLENTAVMYRGVPHYVRYVNDNRRLEIRPLDCSTGCFSVSIDDDELSFQPPRVGYINTPSGAYYLSRVPERRWKQGTSRGSLRMKGSAGKVPEEWFQSKLMMDCMMNRYPTLEEAIVQAREDRTTVAFHRNMAVNHLGSLFFRGNRMGKVTDKGVSLMTVFKCLEGMFGGTDEDL